MDDSYWMRTTPDAACPAFTGSRTVDVAILGGGLTGLHAALSIRGFAFPVAQAYCGVFL